MILLRRLFFVDGQTDRSDSNQFEEEEIRRHAKFVDSLVQDGSLRLCLRSVGGTIGTGADDCYDDDMMRSAADSMFRQFFEYYRPYRGLFYLDFGCAVIVGLLELGFPLAVNQFVDNLLPSENWPLILLATAVLLGIYALNTVLQYVVTYWGHMLGINIETDMRRKLFDHIQKLSFRFFDNNKTGHLIARITTDLQDIGELAHHGPEDVFIAIMTLLGAFALMLMINWQLALLTFAVIPVIVWVAMYFSGKMTRTYRQLFRDLAQFNARIEDSVGGIRVVKAFANEDHERGLFAVDNANYRQTKLIAYEIMARSLSLSYMLMRFVIMFVMVAGTWFVLQGRIELRRVYRLSAAHRCLLPSHREDQLGDRELPQGYRRLQALPGDPGYRAGHRGGTGRHDRRASRRQHPSRRRDLRLR